MWPEDTHFTEEYHCKSSPGSSSDTSFATDTFDISDDDFMSQLSSTLDIPLLHEDEMAVLNSFISKEFNDSSDIFTTNSMDVKQDNKFLNDELKISEKDFTNHSSQSSDGQEELSYLEYLRLLGEDELDLKSEVHSEESFSSSNSLEPSTPPPIAISNNTPPPVFFPWNISPKKEIDVDIKPINSTIQVVPQSTKPLKVPIKRVPIQPKAPYTVPSKAHNIVVINNLKNGFPNVTAKNSKMVPNKIASNIVILDSIPINSFKTLNPTVTPTVSNVNKPLTIPSLSVRPNMQVDPRVLKRQERKIKNRESASMSRKKKKDYLNSLEELVQRTTQENKKLKEENASLKERLSLYENTNKSSFSISSKTTKPAVFLCAFLLVVGLNFNIRGHSFTTKSNKVNTENSDYPKLSGHYSRNLLWSTDDNANGNNTYFSPLTMCPASINQTESARVLLELERWIGKPDSPKLTPVPEKPSNQKVKWRRKKLRLDSSLAQLRKRELYGPENDVRNGIQVFNPKPDQLYSEFYQAINRRDDTFYVVSFSEQHMLLPALYHNNTRRPKMSLLIPSVYPNDTTSYIPLMQIDCEVLDTKLVNVKYGSIPRPYRQYENVTKEEEDKGSVDNTTNYTDKTKAYKPYFLSKNPLEAVDVNVN
ncbi:cyclic AMP-dependent transcription factor ATF-6 alpha [Euwallacea fornicatus]|uniref:cyclic AMP-dependent transcription factor ATF-6 alpha n=1 Tax=Euwallacea fornicatus TaxID=995702 RepID=UPI00338DC072